MCIGDLIWLGFIQGLTEFFPVSSTAHIALVSSWLGINMSSVPFMSAVSQLGPMMALVVYALSNHWISPKVTGCTYQRTFMLLIVGSIPLGIIGLVASSWIGSLYNLYLIAGSLFVFSGIMLVVEYYSKKNRPLLTFTVFDGLFIGLAQVLALMPGVSRLGATLVMALLLGFTRRVSLRFCLLLGIPAIAGTGLFQIVQGTRQVPWSYIATSTAISFAISYSIISFAVSLFEERGLKPFVVYRMVVAAILLLVLMK